MHNKISIDDIKYTYDDPKEYLVDIDITDTSNVKISTIEEIMLRKIKKTKF